MQASTAQGLFAAFLYFQLVVDRSRGKYEQFTTWVLRTHQYELTSINAADLIKIFGKIAQSRKRQGSSATTRSLTLTRSRVRSMT